MSYGAWWGHQPPTILQPGAQLREGPQGSGFLISGKFFVSRSLLRPVDSEAPLCGSRPPPNLVFVLCTKFRFWFGSKSN